MDRGRKKLRGLIITSKLTRFQYHHIFVASSHKQALVNGVEDQLVGLCQSLSAGRRDILLPCYRLPAPQSPMAVSSCHLLKCPMRRGGPQPSAGQARGGLL